MDLATIVGIVLALGAIAGGNVLEGGHIQALMQPTAAVIVFGGTIGAVVLQYPGPVLRQAMRDLRVVFRPKVQNVDAIIKTVLRLAHKARREGLVSIEKDAADIKEPFLRKAVDMAVDGTDARVLREALETELSHMEEQGETSAKVFEAAGGYAPTIGILGAVLGLIHVMENLSEPAKLGAGIAVAFVATVYGVGSANLLYLPIGGKMRVRLREEVLVRELIIAGVTGLAEGENPRFLERKLAIYASERVAGASAREAETAATARAA